MEKSIKIETPIGRLYIPITIGETTLSSILLEMLETLKRIESKLTSYSTLTSVSRVDDTRCSTCGKSFKSRFNGDPCCSRECANALNLTRAKLRDKTNLLKECVKCG